jgi:hypothetical protein
LGAPDDTFWYATGRSALFQALRALSLEAGSAVLMPAYVAAGVIDPVRALGLGVRFYETGRDLIADPESIRTSIRKDGSIRVLIVIHPMGRPQPVASIRAVCGERGIVFIEDCAQALFCSDDKGRPLGSCGDIALFSLTKHIGFAEGAAIVFHDRNLPRPERARARPWRTKMATFWYRAHLSLDFRMHRTSNTALAGRLLALSGVCYDAYYRIASRDFRALRMARSTWRRIGRLRCEEVALRRRSNLSQLYRTVRPSAFEWVFPDDMPGWMPMAVPAMAARGGRSALVAKAMQRGVFLASLCDRWDFLPDARNFPNERDYLARHFLVPVNEHLDSSQMAELTDVLNEL